MNETIQVISPSHFEKIKKLGAGGVGRVYLAKGKTSNVEYAIKFIKLEQNYELLIEKYIKTVQYISHPCILPIIAYSPPDPAKKRPFSLVTKYQKNGSLLNIINAPQNFTNLIKMKIIYGVIETLRYLHEFKIVHQHLFLTNVLLDDDFNPLVTDIFQDCFSSDAAKLPPESKPFIPPETLLNDEMTFASDVFSFGMLLFTLLSGQLPFKVDDEQIFESIQSGKRPDINLVKAESFRDIITQCWSDDPNKRPTFEELLLTLLRDDITLPLNEDEMIQLHKYKMQIISPSFSLTAISSTSKKLNELEKQHNELQKNFQTLLEKFEVLNTTVTNLTKSVKIVTQPNSEHSAVVHTLDHHPTLYSNQQNTFSFPSLVPTNIAHQTESKPSEIKEVNKEDDTSTHSIIDDYKEQVIQPSLLEPPTESKSNNEPPKATKNVVIVNENNRKPQAQNLLMFPRNDGPRLPMIPITSSPNFMPQAGRRLSTKPPIKPVFSGQPQTGLDSLPITTKPKFTDQSRKNRRNSMQPPIPQHKNRVEDFEEESKLVQGIQPPIQTTQHPFQKINQNLTVSPTPPQYFVENGINYNQPFSQMEPNKSKDLTGAIQCQFEYKPFEGIVYYLTNECQGQNIVDRGLLTITGNSADKNREADLKNLVDFKWNYCWTSENKPDSWIKFDFGKKQLFLTHYTLKTYPSSRNFSHLKNWVIEGSSNGDTWVEIDKRTDNNDLNGRSKVQTFICSNPSDAQIVRLRQIGPNHYGDDYLILTNIEFFGYLL